MQTCKWRAARSESLTEIPDLELDVVVLHRLHVEANRCSKAHKHNITSHQIQHLICTPTKQYTKESGMSIGTHLGSWRRPPPSAADLRTPRSEVRTLAKKADPRRDSRDSRMKGGGVGVSYRGWWSCRHCRGRGRGCGPRGSRTPTRRAA